MTPDTEQIARARADYREELAGGLEPFLLPRRTDCPWCGSERLTCRVRTRDWFQKKPGEFTVDRCGACGHVFQNPRLSEAGLAFYYRDFYDGFCADTIGRLFEGAGPRFRASVAAVTPHVTSGTWLDVGTANGAFPAAARRMLPDTEFHGLDMGEAVLGAERSGRVARAFRGFLTELASTELAGAYDVVSMFHYLEHTQDPRRELAAARAALRPGGHLVIEVPDPESLSARLFGRYWMPWLQPQHLNLVPLANMRKELTGLGFTVLDVRPRPAHVRGDVIAACWFLLNRVLPRDDVPWDVRRPGAAARFVRKGGVLAALPALAAAQGLDALLAVPARRGRLANAYRVIARRGA
ncbi:class I SAM-dependent methyltransferase [Streptomyces sp. MP131-18]|uniref:class I SAM-dependent methyltransferase n=1 Tax=Streptomyces sp. MP131-18 TaxID=1857892 RepID=UPI0009C67362|nr:class I SAM-dependent methyltransferase [Streptomyces sp. MP131-18]ONK14109.1 Methyltransferase domain protein [Streptomyces sp. MP131-18]